MNLFEYVKKYNYTFEEKEFNEVDNLVFAVLAYVDYNNVLGSTKESLLEVANKFDKLHTKKDYKYDMSAVKDAIKVLNIAKNSKRYKDVLMYNNVYIGNEEEQFSAITFDINNKVSYIAFEGTDKLVSGWFEDVAMSYKFPVPSQKSAIKYLNKYFTFSNRKLIVGGHSKGGNLALVAAMYANIFVRNKIIKVYSNDGQGLKKSEIESKRYKDIYSRYNHIIPYNSLVGILLRHEDFSESISVDSTRPIVFSHAAASWVIKDDHFVRRDVSIRSKKIDRIISNWLDKYDYSTRKYFVEDIFNVLKKNNITEISQFKENYINIIRLIKYSSSISDKSKEMLNDLKGITIEINKDIKK